VIVLDIDIISVLDQDFGVAYESLTRRLAIPATARVCVTIISFEEQMRGWLSYIAEARTRVRVVAGYARLHQMVRWYEKQEVLDYDQAAAARFDELRRERVRIGTMDLRIAAIALERGALLVSRNLRDFRRVPGLRVEDWTLPE